MATMTIRNIDDASKGRLRVRAAVHGKSILYGVALLPSQARLADAIRPIFDVDFEGRILPFDSTAAVHFAEIATLGRNNGQSISQVDAQIAAITRSRGAKLATRNQRDFIGCDIELVDPWN